MAHLLRQCKGDGGILELRGPVRHDHPDEYRGGCPFDGVLQETALADFAGRDIILTLAEAELAQFEKLKQAKPEKRTR